MKTLLFIISCLCFSFAVAQPVADFTAKDNKTSGCSPLAVTFNQTGVPGGTGATFNWDLGNGQLPTGPTVATVYTKPGTYTVKLVVSNASGTSQQIKTDYITVFASPDAKFTTDHTVGCNPVTVTFTDQSTTPTGTITSRVWDFNDPPQAPVNGGPTATHQYTTPGFYSPSLVVTSSTGCSTKVAYPRLIRVVQGIDVNFQDKPTTTCKPPYQIPIVNETSGPGTLNYTWHYNGNTSNNPDQITASYDAPGTYPVTLVASSNLGCLDSATKNITITPYNSSFSINSPDTACPNQSLIFTNTSSPRPSTFSWDFGDSTSISAEQPSKSYSTAGTYVVTLLNDFKNCKDTVQKTITISNHIPTDFTATDNAGCKVPHDVTFQSTTPANQVAHYHWDFGDGTFADDVATPTHTYSALGGYDVTLTITTVGGCEATMTKPKFVQIAPGSLSITGIPAFGCVPFPFSPSAISTTPDPIVQYQWTFGDGGTSNQPLPTHTYGSVGTYDVGLTVQTKSGCTLTTNVPKTVHVGNLPGTIDFTSSTPTPCATGGVQFNATSSPPVTDYLWDFGDGTPVVDGANPLHNFSDTGFFTVTLIARDNGCPKTVIKNNFVHVLPPLARFTHAVTNCADPRDISFTNTSKVNPALGAVTYQWQFGDPANSTSSAANPIFHYPDTGKYVVKLTVTNGACSHTFFDTLRVSLPQANFTVSKAAICKFEKIMLTATVDTSKISTYNWSFNGGPQISRPYQFDTSFAPTGAYSVTLNAIDKNGCLASSTKNAFTVSGPAAKIGSNVPGGCSNTTVTFLDSSTSPIPLKQWTWNFGDTSATQTFTAPPFNHTYSKLGVYAVRVTITDNNGCTDTATLRTPISITKPKAGFKADFNTFCPGVDFQFIDTSSGTNLQYIWDFGDGSKSTQSNPKHTYSGTDVSYPVKLHVVDNVGCADSATVQNFVHILKPKAAFTFKDTSSICNLLETSFTFGAKDYSDFYWDFGDSTQSISMNPQHFYNAFGQYTATLYAIGNGGCYDSAQKVVNLYNPTTNTQVTYSPLSACNELTVDFNIVQPPNTTFSFYFGEGNWDSTQNTVLHHLYNRPGYYQPIVLLKDQYDCQAAVAGNSGEIAVLGALPFFNIDKKKFCDTAFVNISNFTIFNDPVVSQVWNFGDSTTSTDKDPAPHSYNQSGLYLVSLTVQTATGCVNTRTDSVFVYRTPDPSILSPDEICVDAQVAINGILAQPDTAISWIWTFGDSRGSTTQNNMVAYNTVGNYTLNVEAANLLGCKGAATKPIIVHPNPTIQTKNVTIPLKGSVLLPVSYSGGVTTFTWQPPAGLSCTDCAVPIATPQSSTTYNVSVIDSNSCVANADLTVSVVCTNNNYFVPNTFSPNGDGMNDVFYPRGNALTRIAHMQIFNRWGQLIFDRRNFSANDASMGWDGKVNGQLAPQDVYVFIVDFICENSQIVPYKGNVALIR